MVSHISLGCLSSCVQLFTDCSPILFFRFSFFLFCRLGTTSEEGGGGRREKEGEEARGGRIREEDKEEEEQGSKRRRAGRRRSRRSNSRRRRRGGGGGGGGGGRVKGGGRGLDDMIWYQYEHEVSTNKHTNRIMNTKMKMNVHMIWHDSM